METVSWKASWIAYEPYSKKILGFLGLEIHTKLNFS